MSSGKILTLAIILLSYILLSVSLIRLMKKEAKQEQDRYEEATKWYESLSESEKARIMDILWTKHPEIKNGVRFMTSIYTVFTNKK